VSLMGSEPQASMVTVNVLGLATLEKPMLFDII
jgi:hypothetical protein